MAVVDGLKGWTVTEKRRDRCEAGRDVRTALSLRGAAHMGAAVKAIEVPAAMAGGCRRLL